MTAILGWIVGLFGPVFTWIAGQIAARYGIQLALVAVYIAAAGVFLAAISTAGSALQSTMPSAIQTAFNYLPSAIGPCVSAILAGETAAYVYRQIVIVASIKTRI